MKKKQFLALLIGVLGINLLFVPLSKALADSYNGSLSEMIAQTTGNAHETTPSSKNEVTDDGITIQGKFYTNEEFIALFLSGDKVENAPEYIVENNKINLIIQPRMLMALPGIYLIPGIGEVAVTATGLLIIGLVTIKTESIIYNTIVSFLKDPANVISSEFGIPKGMLDSNGKLKMKDFKNKHGKDPSSGQDTVYKNNKGWTLDKDKANHGGTEWKLKNKNGKRVGSVHKDGKVVRTKK